MYFRCIQNIYKILSNMTLLHLSSTIVYTLQVYHSLKLWFSISVDHHISNNERLSKIGQNNRAHFIISKCVKQFTYLHRHTYVWQCNCEKTRHKWWLGKQLLKQGHLLNYKYFYHLINGLFVKNNFELVFLLTSWWFATFKNSHHMDCSVERY